MAREDIQVVVGLNPLQFEREMNKLTRSLKDMAGKLSNLGKTMTMGITAPIVGAGVAAAKLAMDAVESENLFEVSMGGMAKAARAWSEQLREDLGLNAYEVRKQVGTFNVMFDSMGLGEQAAYDMATGLTQLANDMASFYNLDTADAFQKLQAGITGEIEPLKRLGIVINEEAVKNYAYANGIAEMGAKLTDQEKIQARYGLIMEQTAKAQGDLARTIESPTNQLRILGAEVKNMTTDLGMVLLPVIQQHILPALRGLADRIGSLVAWFGNLSPGLQQIILGVLAFAAALGPLLLVVGNVIGAVASITAALPLLGTAMAFMTGPIGVVTAALAALVAGGVLVYKNWDYLKAKAGEVWDGIKTVVKNAANGIIGFINAIIGAAEKMVNAIAGAINKIPRITISSWVPGIGGNSFGMPKIDLVSFAKFPLLAEGGTITGGGWAMVGEAGPELLSLPRGAQVQPLSAGAGAVNVVVELDGYTIARAIGQPLTDLIRVKTGLRL